MNNQKRFPKKFIPSLRLLLPLISFLFFSNLLSAQQNTVTGKVKDENDNPLQGVSITIKGKPYAGTTTDATGNFSLGAALHDVLVFEFVGYQQQEIILSSYAGMNITLHLADTKLDEVVVIGYGTKLKGELTGAVSKVDSKAFERPAGCFTRRNHYQGKRQTRLRELCRAGTRRLLGER
ncbi:MAG TPA: carboxypeptidase-like regulatory domain-containing protein [Agriterribacter sp.]|nr:carboxypeptidase-like regulatory domain-containing protein [Agriterribacter sp.]